MQRTTETPPRSSPWDSLAPHEAPPAPDERSPLQRIRGRLMRLVPRPLVRRMAAPYIAGETRRQAIELVSRLHAAGGLCSTVDVLGEDVRDQAESRALLEEYSAILDDLGRSRHANISIKLSALGQSLDEDLCAANLETLLSHAARYDQFVRFDMEDHTTTDSTLGFYRRFVGRFPRIGVVLQSRLHRTARDVEELSRLKPNVRLCLGIYREPVSIAVQDKPSMKRRLLELLEMMWNNGQYVAIATHDESLIHQALAMGERMGRNPADFEVQMLLGVPRDAIQRELLARDIKVRLYVPYGRHWYNYCLRRLDNNPEMARMVLLNLFRRGAGY
ncbi:MAG TPA: proline dehydrogenase family protein [Candidatus Polarisedimenticolia bacterium]|nr:proline dehydrogenase family protein [Candidatus Polarisedimenticolia bacterium]